jgi:hypothetical protein
MDAVVSFLEKLDPYTVGIWCLISLVIGIAGCILVRKWPMFFAFVSIVSFCLLIVIFFRISTSAT